MTDFFDKQNNCDPEWPAAPTSEIKQHLNLFKKIWMSFKALYSLITTTNIKKAIQHTKNFDLTLVLLASRGLWLDKLAVLVQQESDYNKVPITPLASNRALVSVIIPCFNYGKFVEAAIDSVLAQTVTDIEVIVVDGGSTDPYTKELLNNLNKPRTRILFREGRHYVGSNRNFGIEQASGRYICCLDADDTLAPTYFEKALFLLENYAYDCVSTAICFVGNKKGTVSLLEFPDLKAMMAGNHIHTCALFRRTLWTRVGGYFDTGIGKEHIAEDWDYFLRLTAYGARVRNITGEALFNYQIHESGSLSTNNVRSIPEQRKAILERNKSTLTLKNKRRSRNQASRRLLCTEMGGELTNRMINYKNDRGTTVLLAMPLLIIGGAERLLSEVIRSLSNQGWQFIIVTSLPQDQKDGDSFDWFAESTPQIYRLPAFLNRDEWDHFVEYLIETRKPDCLLIAGSRYFYEQLPYIRKRFPSMAAIDLLFNTIGHVESHKIYRTQFTSVIAENSQVESWFKSVGWPTERIKCISSGVDTSLYKPVKSNKAWRASLGIAPDALLVGFSGRFSEEKAPDIFIEIAQLCDQIPMIHFIMTGGGHMAYKIEQKILNLKLKNINYLGLVDDVKTVVAQYDVLVLPSRNDGRPQVVLEALSMGVPVIASDVGGLSELISNGQTGFICPPADPVAFTECLSKLMNDRSSLNRMKKAARLFAIKELKIDSMISKYHDSFLKSIEIHKISLTATKPTT